GIVARLRSVTEISTAQHVLNPGSLTMAHAIALTGTLHSSCTKGALHRHSRCGSRAHWPHT
ncbi:MAG: hypothetical protein ACI9MC_003381, partial [Kiritimatiellia bacterium]